MKLWLLEPQPGLPYKDNPWAWRGDTVYGVIIRAETETQARQMAQEDGGTELTGLRHGFAQTESPWLDPTYSHCRELCSDGPAEIILSAGG